MASRCVTLIYDLARLLVFGQSGTQTCSAVLRRSNELHTWSQGSGRRKDKNIGSSCRESSSLVQEHESFNATGLLGLQEAKRFPRFGGDFDLWKESNLEKWTPSRSCMVHVFMRNTSPKWSSLDWASLKRTLFFFHCCSCICEQRIAAVTFT